MTVELVTLRDGLYLHHADDHSHESTAGKHNLVDYLLSKSTKV
jgi:hypothetical protein